MARDHGEPASSGLRPVLILELPEPHRERPHRNRLRRPSCELLFPAVDENRGFVLMREETMELIERDDLTGRHGLSRFDLDSQYRFASGGRAARD